jgi:hypothetical protein
MMTPLKHSDRSNDNTSKRSTQTKLNQHLFRGFAMIPQCETAPAKNRTRTKTHELLSIFSVEIGFNVAVSQRIICLSDILENPVVTALSRSPNQTTLDPLIPPWPSACLIGSEPARGSYIRICLSREVCRVESYVNDTLRHA